MPLAFAFLNQHPSVRILAIFLALISDGLDGYLARKTHSKTQLGTLLDPLMDKFFVLFAISILVFETHIEPWQVCAMFCRDFAIIVFGIHLMVKGQLLQYKPRAILCGKITTVLQMLVLMGLSLNLPIPFYFYYTFIGLGILALIELAFKPNLPLSL